VFDADGFTDLMISAGYARKTCTVYRPPLVRAAAAGIDLERVGPRELRDYADGLPHTRSSRALLRSALGCYWSLTGRHDGPLGAIRDLRAVQELAGHASPETTAGYTRATRRRLLEAVAAIEYS
jgi:integrase